jgi:hypothetical protein
LTDETQRRFGDEERRLMHLVPAPAVNIQRFTKERNKLINAASVRLGPKTLRTLDEEVKSLVSAWRSRALFFCVSFIICGSLNRHGCRSLILELGTFGHILVTERQINYLFLSFYFLFFMSLLRPEFLFFFSISFMSFNAFIF